MNRLTSILGVKYPILLGAMRQITLGEMAAQVSESGGFGQLATSFLSVDSLQAEIQKARRLTSRPIGINIPLHRPHALDFLFIAAEMGIKTVTTSGGHPGKIMPKARELGISVIHKVSTTAMALKAQDSGVSAVIATGFEAGGHGGKAQITTLCLVPQLTDALDIPVVAAGGICDGRTLAAALALGADGVEIGTRFLSSIECPIPDFYKEAVVAAADNGTTCLGHGKMYIRVLRNKATETPAEGEDSGTSLNRADYVGPDADLDWSVMPAGMGSGMIHDIVSIDRIMERLMHQAGEAADKLSVLLARRKEPSG